MQSTEVIVIGAGAAGLAAAAELSREGIAVCVLEARDRIGGRIFTRYEPDFCAPIELGAEFIHGRSPATLSWLKRANIPFIDASDDRWTCINGKLQRGTNQFEQMKRGLERAPHPKHDLPFANFLAGPARRHLSPAAREFARSLVEGFDAADAQRVSTLQTLKGWSSSGAADAPTFRPVGGYGALIRGIAANLDPHFAELRLNTVVRHVKWSKGRVSVAAEQNGRRVNFEAAQCIVALPLGVLQLSPRSMHSVQFDPPLKAKETALTGLGVGPVTKVSLRFKDAFWEKIQDGRLQDAAFFHIPKAPFRTFWTTLHLRSPLLCAWAGGPNALRWSGRTENEITGSALECLELLFGKRTPLRESLQATYVHDWQADPFACGAYSFVLAGGGDARKQLAVPLNRALYFAGEAADAEGESGTVAGALQSGTAAARAIIRSRKKTQARN